MKLDPENPLHITTQMPTGASKMNDTTSPSHPPPSSDSVQPGASYAQCGDHAKCFEH